MAWDRYLNTSDVERFWSKVEFDTNGGCWLFSGAPETSGYGAYRVAGRQMKAHRYSWLLAHGDLPDGAVICHRCDVRSCVNPAHLFCGTVADNNADMLRKGRHRPGMGRARLTEQDVAEIRAFRRAGVSRHELAALYGVRHDYIAAIVSGRSWSSVSGAHPLVPVALRGELNGNAKLTPNDVLAIRDGAESGAAIARRLGVSKSLVNSIRRGDAWRHM